jgi:3-oxocholest-4-en-26-oyl-CoA dehydrogenase beta subunit
MDFNFTEEQTMVRDLVQGILEKEITHERLKKIEADADWFDRPLWATLAETGVLGLVVPEALGGMGFGFLELCILLQEIGRAVAPVPVFPTLVLGALPIREFGTEAQQQTWLAGVTAGETILTAALAEDVLHANKPGTSARKDGNDWILDGQMNLVPAAHIAQRVLVPAATAEGVGIFLVDPQSNGVTLTRHKTSTGEPLCTVQLADVRVAQADLLGNDATSGADKVAWIVDRAVIATCATQLGVSEKALELTAKYVSEREQFGVPIGTFQAVQHRSANGYIDLQAMRWMTWRAACRLSAGAAAMRETAAAKFWAAEGGSNIANAAQHLHGGIGVDVDYPLHRYFLWSKALELGFGGATHHLVRLGRDLARSGLQELI